MRACYGTLAQSSTVHIIDTMNEVRLCPGMCMCVRTSGVARHIYIRTVQQNNEIGTEHSKQDSTQTNANGRMQLQSCSPRLSILYSLLP